MGITMFDEIIRKCVTEYNGISVGDKVKVIDKNYNVCDKELYVIFITEYDKDRFFFHCSYDKNAKIASYYFGVNQIRQVN